MVQSGYDLSPIALPFISSAQRKRDPFFKSLPGVLDDCLPDTWGEAVMRRVFEQRKFGRVTPLKALAWIGSGGMGALSFHPEFPPGKKPGSWEAVHAQILAKEAREVVRGAPADLFPRIAASGGSVGGACPKALVAFALMARAAGIEVCKTRLIPADDPEASRRSHLLIERFDVLEAGRRRHIRCAAGMKASKPLRILILGGTQFIGIHMTEVARQRGHTVSLFHRGQNPLDLFPDVERIRGDRDGKLDGLKGRRFDAVIDISAYFPRQARLSSQLLAPNIGRYLFISTISVYADFSKPNDEESRMAAAVDETVDQITATTYGPLKVACEKVVADLLGSRATILRPAIVAGPYDYTDRLTHYPARAARGGEMIAPGAPQDTMQFIDVRDLARFAIHTLEQDVAGTYNVIRPPGTCTIGDVIKASVESANALAKPSPPPRPVWIPEEFLRRHCGDTLPQDFPLWGHRGGAWAGFNQISAERASKAGLTITPLETTIHDVLAWHLSRPAAERTSPKAGISREREREILAAWRQE